MALHLEVGHCGSREDNVNTMQQLAFFDYIKGKPIKWGTYGSTNVFTSYHIICGDVYMDGYNWYGKYPATDWAIGNNNVMNKWVVVTTENENEQT